MQSIYTVQRGTIVAGLHALGGMIYFLLICFLPFPSVFYKSQGIAIGFELAQMDKTGYGLVWVVLVKCFLCKTGKNLSIFYVEQH